MSLILTRVAAASRSGSEFAAAARPAPATGGSGDNCGDAIMSALDIPDWNRESRPDIASGALCDEDSDV